MTAVLIGLLLWAGGSVAWILCMRGAGTQESSTFEWIFVPTADAIDTILQVCKEVSDKEST